MLKVVKETDAGNLMSYFQKLLFFTFQLKLHVDLVFSNILLKAKWIMINNGFNT